MNNQRIGAVVLARVNSQRLPEKVLKTINGLTSIEILINHVVPSDDNYDVVLAIRKNKEDDILESIGEQKGILVYRGEDDSPLHRLLAVAEMYDFNDIVRITSDDILIDQLIMRNQIKFHLREGYDYTYCARLPEGCGVEVISRDALRRVVAEVGDKPVEFVSYYMKRKGFNYKEFYPHSFDFQYTYRLTMDYEEDLTLLRIIFNQLRNPGTLDIINFLKNNKYLLNINKLPAVTVYTCNYNTAGYIKDCMDSVFAQSFEDFEFIVLDDCSSDGSLNVITEYYSKLDRNRQRKMKVLRNDENIGLPASCNKVLTISRGKYIIRIDSDDYLLPDAISKMVEKSKMDDSKAVLSGYIETKSQLTQTVEVLDRHQHPSGALFDRSSVNELKFKEGLDYLEGDEFFERFNQAYNVSHINEPLWLYRRHSAQKTAQSEHPNNKGTS